MSERKETEERKKKPTPPPPPNPRWTFDREIRDANKKIEKDNKK